MPAKLPRLTSQKAERMLLKAGFEMIRSKGSHRIYMKGDRRVIVPFHSGKTLHPKVVRQVFKAIEDTEQDAA
ncbi:type II toxin-antitoxin system HicA family toxin [Candidatus Methanoperedens nitratireducens]|uniref:YcfA family protein n=1 Tax=Candidatus Methanoperedens nitratireducens TaxID=1392998 RepID=A0A284VL70_9EURY|nr:type II toxin-antitoxin system HicA family toxin [Candidatus Methanoperedens nitroreducens]SNQ59937.1 YcfA family protein [Candidatus Methanoperedens nitroreducens]